MGSAATFRVLKRTLIYIFVKLNSIQPLFLCLRVLLPDLPPPPVTSYTVVNGKVLANPMASVEEEIGFDTEDTGMQLYIWKESLRFKELGDLVVDVLGCHVALFLMACSLLIGFGR